MHFFFGENDPKFVNLREKTDREKMEEREREFDLELLCAIIYSLHILPNETFMKRSLCLSIKRTCLNWPNAKTNT